MSALSIRDMASIGFPLGRRDSGLLLMLKAYFDDTGTHANSRLVGVGGLIGTEAQWAEFDVQWKRLLAEPIPGKPPISAWSTHDCAHGIGEFDRYNQAERDRATFNFRKVLADCRLVSFIELVDKAAWDELIVPAWPLQMSAEATALFTVTGHCLDYAQRHPDGPDIAVYYDAARNRGDVAGFAEQIAEAQARVPFILSLSFMRVRDATPLQAADMVATEAYWYVLKYLEKGEQAEMRAHMRAYLNWNVSYGRLFDRQQMLRELGWCMPNGLPNPYFQWNERLS